MSSPGCCLDSCCVIASLKFGCFFFGFLTIVEGTICLMFMSVILFISGYFVAKPKCSASSKHCLKDAATSIDFETVFVYLVYSLCIMWIMFCILFMIGIEKKQLRLIKPWIVFTFIEIFMLLFLSQIQPLFLYLVILKVYSCWVVFSYINKLKREENAPVVEEGRNGQIASPVTRLHRRHNTIGHSSSTSPDVPQQSGSAYMTVLLPRESTPSPIVDRNKLFITPPPSYSCAVLHSAIINLPSTSLSGSSSIHASSSLLRSIEALRIDTPPPSYEEALASASLLTTRCEETTTPNHKPLRAETCGTDV